MSPVEDIPNGLHFGHIHFSRLEIDKVLDFSYKGVNEAVDGIEDNDDNYSIYSVSSREDSFVHL